MAIRIKVDEPLPHELRRMAREQLEEARDAAADSRRALAERVHEVRTSMKKVRALNRLVRPAVGQRARRADRRLRKIAHSVSALRDAEVVLKAFDHAVGRWRAALAPIRSRLAAHLRDEARAFHEQGLDRRLRSDLAHERRQVETWIPKAHGWSAIGEGLTRGYRRAREAMDAAYRSETGDDFHAWRRAVKAHRHHMAALETMAPGRMKARVDELDRLGDLLGDEHDLTVLEGTIGAELSQLADRRPGDHLLQRIAQRRAQLRRRARPLGKRLFAERPSAFRDRVRGYFRAARS